MTCKDCIHSEVCYKKNDYENFPDRCGEFISDKVLEERLQGKWIEKYSDYGVYYQCSNCHKMPPNYECDYKEGAIKTNFCPNCGADMRGDKNG